MVLVRVLKKEMADKMKRRIGDHYYELKEKENSFSLYKEKSFSLYKDDYLISSALHIEKEEAIKTFRNEISKDLLYQQKQHLDKAAAITEDLLNKDSWKDLLYQQKQHLYKATAITGDLLNKDSWFEDLNTDE